MVVTGDRASRYVCMFLSCLFQTITCMTDCQGEDSILRSQANISCLYSEFNTITCTWSLEECYKFDDKKRLNVEENVHIHYSFNVESTQYCYRDKQLYLQCVCLQSGETKCSWSHKRSHASESLSLLVTISDSSTSELISSYSKQFEAFDIEYSSTYLRTQRNKEDELNIRRVTEDFSSAERAFRDFRDAQRHMDELLEERRVVRDYYSLISDKAIRDFRDAQRIIDEMFKDRMFLKDYFSKIDIDTQRKKLKEKHRSWLTFYRAFRDLREAQRDINELFEKIMDFEDYCSPIDKAFRYLREAQIPMGELFEERRVVRDYYSTIDKVIKDLREAQRHMDDLLEERMDFKDNCSTIDIAIKDLREAQRHLDDLLEERMDFKDYCSTIDIAFRDLREAQRHMEKLFEKRRILEGFYSKIDIDTQRKMLKEDHKSWLTFHKAIRNLREAQGLMDELCEERRDFKDNNSTIYIDTQRKKLKEEHMSWFTFHRGLEVQETITIVLGIVFFVILILCIMRKSGRNGVFSTETEQSVNNAADGGEERQTLLEHRRKRFQDRRGTTNQNISLAEKLLNSDTLPKNEDIQSLYTGNGKDTETLKVCENVCFMIKSKLDNVVTNIWTARNLSSGKIVFVVESRKMIDIKTIIQSDLEIILHHCDITKEKESRKVMERERECLEKGTDELFDNIKMLQKCTSRHSKDLMDKHKNITAILPCVIKSKGFSTLDEHDLLEVLCISIHVKKKVSGLIPLDEEPIPELVDGFPTDVVQGESRIFGHGSNDYHRNLKIGSAIHAAVQNKEGCILGGTLGCFVRHETYGMCCITNAHVVLSNENLQLLLKCNYMEYGKYGVSVFQPLSEMSASFGKVVAVAYNEGHSECAGVEVALIQMLDRLPISGSFPRAASEKVPTFTFDSGNVTDASLLKPYTAVFKFGMETEQTIGTLGIPCAFVHYDEGIQLHNQLVVSPAKGEAFAAPGDSGSSVFIGYSRPGTESVIGLISGGLDDGRVIVTPIHNVLQSLKCKPYLHRFENSNDSGINVSMPPGVEEYMDCN